MSCLRPIRTRVSVMRLCLDENDCNYSPLILCIEQMLVYNTGLIPSRFYEVLLDSDKASFKSIVITSSLLILGTALVSCKIGPLGILNYLVQTHINEALPGGGRGPRSLVGILKCLVSAFSQGFTPLSEIERHTLILSLSVVCRYFIWALSLLFGPCRLSEFTLAGPH